MKYLFEAIVVLILSNVVFSQEENKCEKVNQFNRIQVYDGIIVSLEQGGENKICPVNETEMGKLQITDTDNILRIRKIPGEKYDDAPRIIIKVNTLNQIEAYTKSELSVSDTLISDSLKIVLKTGAMLYANIKTDHLEAEVIEGSLLKAAGKATSQYIEVASKATFSGFDLVGKVGNVKATTGGIAKVHFTDSMMTRAVTGGFITYKGTPKIENMGFFGGKVINYSD